jgi:hypothetical protein
MAVLLGVGTHKKKWILHFPDENYAQKWQFKHKNIADIQWPAGHALAESIGRAVNDKGLTQHQWLQLVQTKFPDAKIVCAKMIDGPCRATLPDGRTLSWTKVDQGTDGNNNSTGGVKPVETGKFNPEFNKALQTGIDQRTAARDKMQANVATLPTYTKKGVAESTGQDSKSWMASIRQQHPDVRFVQAKMPGAPIMAMVNGKPVAQWDGKQQGELPLQEKKRSDRESNATVGDTKVARELQKLRAQYPAARNDVEVVAKSEIDSNERSQQQLAAINGANTEQDQLLKQLVALDKQQGKEIGSLDNENDRLEQQLKHVEQTNAKLAQAIDQIAGETPSKGADDAGPTRSKSVNLAPADAPAQPQAKREPSDSTPKSDAINRMARDLTQPRKAKGTNQGNVTNLDAFRRAQAAVTNKDFNPMIKAMLDKGVLSRTGTDDRLNEFAPSAGGGSGNYFQALASAWYNGAFDTGSLEKGIKSKEDVERLLNRGIIGPDGVTRKYAIDYNSTFDGVVISSDDYYEHAITTTTRLTVVQANHLAHMTTWSSVMNNWMKPPEMKNLTP